MKRSAIAIIGAGAVGVTTAYALLMNNVASEIWLADINESHTQGELFDLEDSLSFSKTSAIRYVAVDQASQAQIIIIAAGAAQKIGQSRLDLLNANYRVMKNLSEQLMNIDPDTIILAVTNPVDIITSMLQFFLNHPKEKIIGSGTFLDSWRFRGFIASTLKVSASSIHAYILGEHGDSQFPAWSSAQVAGKRLLTFEDINETVCDEIFKKTKMKAYEIINKKGATYYGIASCVSYICQIILADKHSVLPLSSFHSKLQVCLSLPVVLGREGIVNVIEIDLSEREQFLLFNSVDKIKENLRSIGM